VPLVTQVMKAEMKKQGMAVNNHVCEHFPYSRQELYHLVRVGRSRPSTTCWPSTARAGLRHLQADRRQHPGLVLERVRAQEEHASLQDSNDYFLANIQKDGTYSVVPRMPGGEVTPDGLIAVGQVAKKYGLYTKITGGRASTCSARGRNCR
jgi:nitrite reductase (NADH) large subunit